MNEELEEFEEIFDARGLSSLVDAVFGMRVDESGERVSLPLYSKPELIPVVNRIYSQVIYTLTPREEKIIRMRFGLDADAHTRKDVARHFQITAARVSQIEKKALRKLRHPARSRRVIEYLDEHFRGEQQLIAPSPELTDVIGKIKKLTPELIAHLRRQEDDLIKVHPRVFEHLIAEFFASWGFDDVRLVGTNSRTSADVYVAKVVNPLGVENRYFIEVKRWRHKVGIEIINQVLGAMISEREQFGWHAAMIVTVAGFTDFKKWDRQQLKLKGVELKDKGDLLKWLRDYKESSNGLWLPEPPTII